MPLSVDVLLVVEVIQAVFVELVTTVPVAVLHGVPDVIEDMEAVPLDDSTRVSLDVMPCDVDAVELLLLGGKRDPDAVPQGVAEIDEIAEPMADIEGELVSLGESVAEGDDEGDVQLEGDGEKDSRETVEIGETLNRLDEVAGGLSVGVTSGENDAVALAQRNGDWVKETLVDCERATLGDRDLPSEADDVASPDTVASTESDGDEVTTSVPEEEALVELLSVCDALVDAVDESDADALTRVETVTTDERVEDGVDVSKSLGDNEPTLETVADAQVLDDADDSSVADAVRVPFGDPVLLLHALAEELGAVDDVSPLLNVLALLTVALKDTPLLFVAEFVLHEVAVSDGDADAVSVSEPVPLADCEEESHAVAEDDGTSVSVTGADGEDRGVSESALEAVALPEAHCVEAAESVGEPLGVAVLKADAVLLRVAHDVALPVAHCDGVDEPLAEPLAVSLPEPVTGADGDSETLELADTEKSDADAQDEAALEGDAVELSAADRDRSTDEHWVGVAESDTVAEREELPVKDACVVPVCDELGVALGTTLYDEKADSEALAVADCCALDDAAGVCEEDEQRETLELPL